MEAAKNNLSMAISTDETTCFLGSLSGEILSLDIDDFAIRSRVQAHTGGIHAMAVHSSQPYLAAMSTDRKLSVWRIDGAKLSLLFRMGTRQLKAQEDEYMVPDTQSTSQAIAFHPSKLRVATRSGSGALLEVDFTADGSWSILQVQRLHGEQTLVQIRYVKDGNAILSMANYGHVALFDGERVIRNWRFGNHNVHWAEPVGGETYLLASDTRKVFRLDLLDDGEPICGDEITRDDLEHVTYNPVSKRAFVSGFDGSVYEIDPESCQSLGVVFQAPYKCRWAKSLKRDPDIFLLQCRNGMVFKTDMSDPHAPPQNLRQTPLTLWSAIVTKEKIFAAGEGNSLTRLGIDPPDDISRASHLTLQPPLKLREGRGHVKRLAHDPSRNRIFAAATDGQLTCYENGRGRTIFDAPLPLRDLSIDPVTGSVFTCDESGGVYRIDDISGAPSIVPLFKSPSGQPIWSIALNAQQSCLAAGEREGVLTFIDARTGDLRDVIAQTKRPKRMIWNGDTLYWANNVSLLRYDINSEVTTTVVSETGNTIEDFIWNETFGYLVVMNYNCRLMLCDLQTGQLLDNCADGMDYSKGVAWLPVADGSYPLDFISWGRGGAISHFRIHDEKIIKLSALSSGLMP